MQDAWRAYMELALGLTEASRKKAMKVAKELLGKGGATAEQLPALAEELIRTSAANREAITKLVRYELDRAMAAVGLATSEEVADLTARIRDLERQLQEVEARTQAAAAPAPAAPARPAGPTGTTAKAVRKTTARKTAAKSAQAEKAAAKRTAAKQTAAKRTAAKRTAAKQTAAKKTAPRRAGAA